MNHVPTDLQQTMINIQLLLEQARDDRRLVAQEQAAADRSMADTLERLLQAGPVAVAIVPSSFSDLSVHAGRSGVVFEAPHRATVGDGWVARVESLCPAPASGETCVEFPPRFLRALLNRAVAPVAPVTPVAPVAVHTVPLSKEV